MDSICQAHLSMGFSRQEYLSELPFPSPGDLPDSGIEPGSPALQTDSLPFEPPGKFPKRSSAIHFKMVERGLCWWLSGKESTCQCRRYGSIPDPKATTVESAP